MNNDDCIIHSLVREELFEIQITRFELMKHNSFKFLQIIYAIVQLQRSKTCSPRIPLKLAHLESL